MQPCMLDVAIDALFESSDEIGDEAEFFADGFGFGEVECVFSVVVVVVGLVLMVGVVLVVVGVVFMVLMVLMVLVRVRVTSSSSW